MTARQQVNPRPPGRSRRKEKEPEKKRRARGQDGTRELTRNGRTFWEGVRSYTVGTRRERRYVTGKSEREVLDKLKELPPADEGLPAPTMALAAYLERWLEHKRRSKARSTMASYENTVRVHLAPHLGRVRLDRLSPLQVEAMVAAVEADVSAHTARYALKILRMALKQARSWRMVGENAAADTEMPAPKRKIDEESPSWTPGEVAYFLELVAGHRLRALWYVTLATGLRRGEVLALRWADLDLGKGRLRVRQNLTEVSSVRELDHPKTPKGRRTVALAPSTVELLRDHRSRQLALRKAAESWEDHDLVFPLDDGRPRSPHGVTVTWSRLMTKLAIRRITFHGLRHTNASLLARKIGADPKLISAALGHSDVWFTQNTYVHPTLDDLDATALELPHSLTKCSE